MPVSEGSQVSVEYTGRLADGSVFDSSADREPRVFKAGAGQMIAGFDAAVMGMEVGDAKTVTMPPEEAYGPRLEGLEEQVPREVLPEGIEVGTPLKAELNDEVLVLWVTEIGDDGVTLDPNHPLAGETLEFDIEVVAID